MFIENSKSDSPVLKNLTDTASQACTSNCDYCAVDMGFTTVTSDSCETLLT